MTMITSPWANTNLEYFNQIHLIASFFHYLLSKSRSMTLAVKLKPSKAT